MINLNDKLSTLEYLPTHLTAKEIINLRNWAQECKNNKNRHNVTDRKYTKEASEIGLIMFGKSGEVIAAKHYGTTIDWEIYIGADDGFDITINNTQTEIKTSTQQNLIINDPKHCKHGLWKPNIPQALLIHCNQPKPQWENISTNPTFQIIGGTTRENFFQNAEPRNYGHGPRLTLNKDQLYKL